MKQTTAEIDLNPARKVGNTTMSATLGVAVASLIAYLIQVIWGVELPEHIVDAITTILVVIGALIGGYLAKPAPRVTNIQTTVVNDDAR